LGIRTMAEGGAARGRIVQASAETIARYTTPRPSSGRAKPRPPPFGTDNSMPEYPAHRANSRPTEQQAQPQRPVTPQQAMFMFGDEDEGPMRGGRAQPKDALDGFLTSKANPLAQKKAPPSIFGGASGKPITAADTFPDDAPSTSTQPPHAGPAQQHKAATPLQGSGRRGATPLQPANSRRDFSGSQAAHGQPALSMSGGKQQLNVAGLGQALPTAGMGRRRPPSNNGPRDSGIFSM